MMDKETREYIEQILFGLVKREDMEKLRQEMKSNFRQLKEENRNQILGGTGEIRTELERLRREAKEDIGPLQDDFKDGIEKMKQEIQSSSHQHIQILESSLQKIKEDTYTAILQSKQEMHSNFLTMKEEGLSPLAHSMELNKAQVDELRPGLEELGEQMVKALEEVHSLNGIVKGGLNEVKEELGSMIKFSYADLEKKLNALEARIKALEKMVFP